MNDDFKERVDEHVAEAGKLADNAAVAREELLEKSEELASSVLLEGTADKIGKGLKAFAWLSLVVSIGIIAVFVLAVIAIVGDISSTDFSELDGVSTQAIVLGIARVCVNVIQAALFVIFSVRVLRNRRRHAALLTNVMIDFAVASLVLAMMTTGLYTLYTAYAFGVLVFLVVMHAFLDPQLADERRLQRQLKSMDERSDLEEGVLGRDKTGKGYIELNFFNLFWIFVVACFLGWLFEMIVCPILNGRIEDRTGMLFGPFSPIYGVGATLMTMALNRFYKRNPIVVFLVAAVIGAAFEFFVSWFFENAFGILAWDYSGEPFNLFGRTDLFHGVCWGCLGLLFVRFLLPFLLDLINKIPWNWRYGVTIVAAMLMFTNALMTLTAFDCWFQRVSNHTPDTPVAEFFAENFDNDFMAQRFPTMSIDPNRVTHD